MVVAHGAGEDDGISFFHGGGGNGKARRPFTDAGSIDIEAPFAFNNLGVSCYDGNACFSGRFAMEETTLSSISVSSPVSRMKEAVR